MYDITQIQQMLKEHNNLKQVMKKIVCQKYNLEDVDIICVNLQDDVKYGHIFVGTYTKHSNLIYTNYYRFYITLDEYLDFINKKTMKYIVKVEFDEDYEDEYILDTEEETKQLLQELKGTTVSVKIYPTINGLEDVLTDIRERINDDE